MDQELERLENIMNQCDFVIDKNDWVKKELIKICRRLFGKTDKELIDHLIQTFRDYEPGEEEPYPVEPSKQSQNRLSKLIQARYSEERRKTPYNTPTIENLVSEAKYGRPGLIQVEELQTEVKEDEL